MVEYSYVPKSSFIWFLIHWIILAISVDVFRAIERRIPISIKPTILAQSLLATLHSILSIFFCVVYWSSSLGSFIETFSDYGIGLSVSYFFVDSLMILVDVEKQWPYLFHHAIAIFIGLCMSKRVVKLEHTANYMFVIEFSNLFISAWSILRDFKVQYRIQAHHEIQPHNEIQPQQDRRIQPHYDRISMLFAATYVPARTLGLTIVSYSLLSSLDNSISSLTLYPLVAIILIVSLTFSIKVAKIGWSKGLKDFCSFESVTYIVKAYVQVYTLLKIVPNLSNTMASVLAVQLISVDFLHIFTSLYYWSTWHRFINGRGDYDSTIKASLFDFVAINTKIVVNGLCIFTSILNHNVNKINGDKIDNFAILLWISASILNIALLIHNIYKLKNCEKIYIKTFLYRDFSTFLLHFALSALVPVILSLDAPHASIIYYFIGGLSWSLGYNTGFLHVAVIFGDMALLKWLNR